MIKYILKRLLALIPVILGVIFIIQFILYISPNDPAVVILGVDYTPEGAAQVRESLGLNDPFVVQFVRYILDLLRGDFGNSYVTGEPVAVQLAARFPNTLILVVVLYLGGEVVDAVTAQDSVSQLSHIVGGLCGAVLGFTMGRPRPFSSSM